MERIWTTPRATRFFDHKPFAFFMLFGLATTLVGQSVYRPPDLPFFDWNACPGEGCTFGKWTATQSVPLYDNWGSKRKKIGNISAGELVTAWTGVVITYKPGVIRLDRDVSASEFHQENAPVAIDLKRGDTILTYTYLGEGYSAVAIKGKYYPAFDISFTRWPDGSGCGSEHCAATYTDLGTKKWWVQVKLHSGKMAWVDADLAAFKD
jgi:hypothetical protein